MPPTRENGTRQVAADCGWWVLHHVEEEARRKRGEGRWTEAYDRTLRVEQVSNMVAKLKPAEARAKAREKTAQAKEKKEKAAAAKAEAAKAAAGEAEAAKAAAGEAEAATVEKN